VTRSARTPATAHNASIREQAELQKTKPSLAAQGGGAVRLSTDAAIRELVELQEATRLVLQRARRDARCGTGVIVTRRCAHATGAFFLEDEATHDA